VSIFSETRLRQAQPERFDIHIERIFPLTLSSSKGIFAFFDTLIREKGGVLVSDAREEAAGPLCAL
jgi:hypothetical protein